MSKVSLTNPLNLIVLAIIAVIFLVSSTGMANAAGVKGHYVGSMIFPDKAEISIVKSAHLQKNSDDSEIFRNNSTVVEGYYGYKFSLIKVNEVSLHIAPEIFYADFKDSTVRHNAQKHILAKFEEQAGARLRVGFDIFRTISLYGIAGSGVIKMGVAQNEEIALENVRFKDSSETTNIYGYGMEIGLSALVSTRIEYNKMTVGSGNIDGWDIDIEGIKIGGSIYF